MKNKIILFLLLAGFVACSPKLFKAKWVDKDAPSYFKARFITTKGNFDIESQREWSPEAVDRLYMLIKTGFFTDIAIFRVVPNYVAQFGISNNSELNQNWKSFAVIDEPVAQPNEKGTIAFARGGVKTRSTQLFINLKNNSPRLDSLAYSGVKGFPVVARVINGMEVVESFYGEYGEKPSDLQGEIAKEGNSILKEQFPKLDYIIEAYLIK